MEGTNANWSGVSQSSAQRTPGVSSLGVHFRHKLELQVFSSNGPLMSLLEEGNSKIRQKLIKYQKLKRLKR